VPVGVTYVLKHIETENGIKRTVLEGQAVPGRDCNRQIRMGRSTIRESVTIDVNAGDPMASFLQISQYRAFAAADLEYPLRCWRKASTA
jgi:hypothetical protein